MRLALWAALLLTMARPLAAQEAAEPSHAPVPFSADTIRAGITQGELWRFEIEEPPNPNALHTMTFVSVSEDSATVEIRVQSEAGDDTRDPLQSEASWADLEGHAHYAADLTRVEEALIMLPAGTWEGWRYTVDNGDGSTTIAEFARDLPGPPVRLTIRAGDTLVYRMELIEHRDGEAGGP